jgi:hypothetical protein
LYTFLGESIQQSIEKSQLFSIINKESRSEGRYRCFTINYPKTYAHQSLRPELKLEFTESAQEYYPSIDVDGFQKARKPGEYLN